MIYDTYSCEVNEVFLSPDLESYEIPGHDGARASKYLPPGKLLRFKYDDAKTLIEMMEKGCKLSDNGQCVGWRSSKTTYTWLTYREFLTRAVNFGSGMQKSGIKLGQSDRISIYATNSIEWLIAQYSCFYYSSPVVPLYDTIGPEARTFMIYNAETQIVVCDDEKKVKALLDKSDATPVLKHIVYMRDISDEVKQLGSEKGIMLHQFETVEKSGKKNPIPIKPPKPSEVAIICYTSGTTGNPKGAILTHENFISAISGMLDGMNEDIFPNKDDVSISYLPLAHVYEQLVQIFIFLHGGSVGYFSGDLSLLTDDLKSLKPTMFPAVPRVLNKIYDKAESQMKKRSTKNLNGNTNKTAETCINGNDVTEWYNDPIVCKSVSDSLGGRIKLIASGAAPISEKILKFFRSVCNCGIVELYGQTECSGPSNANVLTPESEGRVGPPMLCNMIKLVDVPDLSYFKENNIGEVCIKGTNVFQGYLKDPVKTAEAIDEDGWLHTGDVGKWLPNGTLKIVDRKKQIFKLAQGEYITPEKIELVYSESLYISQIFVHGDSLQSYLVAIVIPEKSEVLAWCKENSVNGSWADICKNKLVKEHILEEMKKVAKIGGLLSFQQVKNIYLHPDPLTIEDGHLTPTQKTKRDVVRKFFLKEINVLYNNRILENA